LKPPTSLGWSLWLGNVRDKVEVVSSWPIGFDHCEHLSFLQSWGAKFGLMPTLKWSPCCT
jgi:hypothetical protein